jgi:tetratricopeptide (TPR) repeat protein
VVIAHGQARAFLQTKLQPARPAAERVRERARADASRALDGLRRLYPRFEALGEASAPLWPSFLESVLDARFFPYLGEADFDGLGAFGDRLAAARVIAPAQSRWLIAEASVARGTAIDLQRAYRLLTELCQAPWIQDDIRLGAAAKLARLGAVGDPQLAVYADVLTRRADPPAEVANLVAAILNVGFDSEAERLRLACSLAMRLGDPAARADTAIAVGLGELLLRQRPRSAARLFAAALVHTAGHAEALRGLISAHLHARDYSPAIAAAHKAAAALDPRCADLLILCQMLAWLEVRWSSGALTLASAAPPATAARLAEIAPGCDTGPWRDYALGRACLIEGDARQAQTLLTKVLDTGQSDTDIHYHAAWAHLLCRNPEGVRASYDALGGEAGSWALGCLLQDAEPGQELPAPLPVAPNGFERVAAAREALIADGQLLVTLDVRCLITPGARQTDLFEALRTALAVAVVRGLPFEPEAFSPPLFARLPAAERLIWTALALHTSDPERSRLMLRHALELGQNRAALLLAVDAVHSGRPGEVRELLRDIRGPKAALLAAWADAHGGAGADAAAHFSTLSGLRLARADYAMALLALRDTADAWAHGNFDNAQAHARNAVTQLSTATTHGTGRFKVSLLKLVAELLASTMDPADVNWQDAAAQPWTARLLGLARLVRAPESVDADLVQRLAEWLPPETHSAALAQAALRVVLLAEDGAARQEAASILIQLSERSTDPDISRAARRGAAATRLRNGDKPADVPGDPLTALVGAGLALTGSDPAEAVRRLRAVESESGQAGQVALATVLANALEGTTPPNPLPFDAPATVAAALSVAAAIGLASAGDPVAAADAVLEAALAHQHEMTNLLDLRRLLPHLLVSATKRGHRDAATMVLAPAMRQAVADEHGSGGLAVACYATLLGDFETAERAWRDLLERTPAQDDQVAEIRREYGRFLCHRAARADLDGDRPAARAHLRLAALYVPDKAREMFAQLESEQLVVTLINTIFPGSPLSESRWRARHPRLAELITANPDLRHALRSGRGGVILSLWQLASLDAGHDIELWHTLAILAREDTFARPVGPPTTDQARITATALWSVLLTDPALRAHFARLTLPAEADEAFRDEITEALLADQKARLTQALAHNDPDAAQRCLHGLDALQRGLTATRRLLDEGPFMAMAVHLAGDEAAFAPIVERVGKLLDAWGADLVAAAERTLTDGEAIRQLGEHSKLDKNYEAALSVLTIALRLQRPPSNVLYAALDWGYHWFLCLYDQDDDEAATAALDVVTPFAKLLMPRCTPGRGHTAENKALGWFSYARGLSAVRSARKAGGTRRAELFATARDLHKESNAWNSEWTPPKQAMCRAEGERLFAIGEFAEAERVLRDLNDDNEQIGVLYNNYGVDRVRDVRALLRVAESAEHVDAAQDFADEAERMHLQALRFQPDDPVIYGNIDSIAEIRNSIARKRQELA